MITDDDQNVEEEVILDTEEQDVEEEIENTDTLEQTEEEEPEIVQDDEEDEEDRIVTIGDSAPEADKPETPGWVKATRKSNKKLLKENKILKRQIEENKREAEKNEPVELGEKPTLAGHKYDEAEFVKAYGAYEERKRKVEEQAAIKAKTVEEQNEKWRSRQATYSNLKQEHSFKDFEEAESLVSDTFSQTQQGIIVQGAEDSALLVYALGKNPKKLEELSKITDPVDFAFKVAKLESQLKVTNRKAPKPETRVSGGKTGASGSSDKVLARLRKEAEKSGDISAVVAYKNKLRDKG